MKKGTKHSTESLQKMRKPKSEEARTHMRKPKSEAMKAKLRVPHSADRKAAISMGMQESPKLKTKRELARDVEIDSSGKWHFKKPEPPIPYQDRVARREMFNAFAENLIRKRSHSPEETVLAKLKMSKGFFCGYQFNLAKARKAYKERMEAGLRDGTLVQNGDYIDEK